MCVCVSHRGAGLGCLPGLGRARRCVWFFQHDLSQYLDKVSIPLTRPVSLHHSHHCLTLRHTLVNALLPIIHTSTLIS